MGLNRSLLGFLVFLVVLAGASGMVAVWVGPTMISLALDDERRNAPYYLVHLISLQEPSEYFSSFSQLLRQEEAQVLWRGGLSALHSGRSSDELADVAIVEFGAGSAVVQMLSSAAYRDLTGETAPLLLGSNDPPGPIARDETVILWLLQTPEGTDPGRLKALSQSASGYGGQLVWSTPVDELVGDRRWNHVLMLVFPDTNAVRGWLLDPETATERALARRHFVADAMLELSSG
jgi:uncharacterized protein (DUF1330 family)